MIAIVGAAHDDILFFESVMTDKRKEILFNRYEMTIGMIFNQEVLLVNGLYTSVLTSAAITQILSHYYINLVINVGKCISISDHYKDGDIVISTKVIDVNCDLTTVQNVEMGQIPGFDRSFVVQNDIINYMKMGFNKRTYAFSSEAIFLSSDNLANQTLDFLKERKSIFGEKENLVLDSNSTGIALACKLFDVPFICVKVVERSFEKTSDIETYLKVLDCYINLGKAVVSTVGDIGRKDILKGGLPF